MLTFRSSIDTFSPNPPVAGGVAMAFVDDLVLPLTARPSCLFFDEPSRSEVWECVLRSRTFESYGTALNDAEMPVST